MPRGAGRIRSRSAIHPPAAFLRNYVIRRGFRDGTAGFLISILNSYYVFLKILKLWELQRGFRTPGPGEAPGASSARRRPKFARTPNVEGRSRVASAGDPRSAARGAEHGPPPSRRCPHRRASATRSRCSRSTSTRRERGVVVRIRYSSPSSACGRSAIGRCSSRTREASFASARKRASTSFRSRPGPKWISTRRGACRASSSSSSPTSSTPTTRTASPWPGWRSR